MKLVKWLSDWLVRVELHSSGKWFLLSAMVGIVAGLGAIAFQFASHAVIALSLEGIAGYVPREPAGEHRFVSHAAPEFSPWMIVGVMTCGGLLSGMLVYSLAPEAEGHGTDAAIDAFHQKRGYIRPHIPIIKLITSAITVGTGGSGGREGPIAQIGAGFGSLLATQLGLSARDRRILLAAGMGAGVGAIFRAPLAGALFAAEILYRDADLESDVLVPAAISSIIGFSVFSLCLPKEYQFLPLFGGTLNHSMSSLAELLPLTALAVILVAGGILYIKTFYGIHAVFKRVPVIPHLRPAIGAALAGLCGVGMYVAFGHNRDLLAVLSTGYGVLQTALENPGTVGGTVLLSVALIKILTTSLTISSGGSGGVFGPSMVIGGCLGAATGVWLHQWLPDLVPNPQIYTIVGMAGFFAGCAHAPISTIIMVSEMTGDYKLLLPTMWVSTLCFLLGRPWSLYQKQVPNRLDSPAHRGDFIVDVLEGLWVRDVPLRQRKTISEGTTLQQIVQLIPSSRQNYFPVVDCEDRLVGVFTVDDVRAFLFDQTLWKLANARDIMSSNLLTLKPDDDLNTALRRFTSLNVDELPVVDAANPATLLGMLRRKDTIAEYNRQLLLRQEADQEVG